MPTPFGTASVPFGFAASPSPPGGGGGKGTSGSEEQPHFASNRFSTNQSRIIRALGVTRIQFREAVHELKGDIPGNPDVIVDITNGDVYDPHSGEYIGNVYDELR